MTKLSNEKTIYLCFIFLFLSFPKVFSIGEESMNDVRALSLGGVRALSKEFTNPASLSLLSQPKIAVGVFNRFEMSELNTNVVRLLFPNRMIDAGFQMSYFGYDEYNLFSAEIGLSKKLNSVISLGAKLLYVNCSNLLNENSENGIKASPGFLFQISPALEIGLLVEDIVTTFNEKTGTIHLGIDYRVRDKCNVLFECSSDMKKNINLNAGFDYEITEQLNFRAGVRTNPSAPSLGAAYLFGHFSIATCFILHQTLGSSSAIEVSYSF